MTRIGWRVPEWWVAAVVPVAWAATIGATLSPTPLAGHAVHVHQPGPQSPAVSVPLEIFCVLGMMVPLILPTLRRVAFASLWPWRHRAMLACLAGYLVVWIAVALVLAAAIDAMITVLGMIATLTFATIAALLWQRTAMKRTALRSCHLMLPLAPSGWRADGDCVGLGVAVGVNCVLSCWALMAVVFAAGHHPLLMLGVLALTAIERFGRSAMRDAASAFMAEVRFAFAEQRGAVGSRLEPSRT